MQTALTIATLLSLHVPYLQPVIAPLKPIEVGRPIIQLDLKKLHKPLKMHKVHTLSTIKPKPVKSPVKLPTGPVNGCGDNSYAHYIYMHESGCRTTATNSIGCYGIGQDCNGIVRTKCGANYACQNQYFTSYVNGRYGGWKGAYNFWLSHSWY